MSFSWFSPLMLKWRSNRPQEARHTAKRAMLDAGPHRIPIPSLRTEFRRILPTDESNDSVSSPAEDAGYPVLLLTYMSARGIPNGAAGEMPPNSRISRQIQALVTGGPVRIAANPAPPAAFPARIWHSGFWRCTDAICRPLQREKRHLAVRVGKPLSFRWRNSFPGPNDL